MTARVDAIAGRMRGANFAATASATILLDMWEKWVFLTALAGATCLLRGGIRDSQPLPAAPN